MNQLLAIVEHTVIWIGRNGIHLEHLFAAYVKRMKMEYAINIDDMYGC